MVKGLEWVDGFLMVDTVMVMMSAMVDVVMVVDPTLDARRR